MRHLYNLLIYLALPFFFLRLLWRSRLLPDYRKRWKERMGFSPHLFNKCIWVHAVSVGETIAAVPLIKALKNTYPTLPLLVTNMTPTGAARVKAAFGDEVFQAYIPYDFPDAMERFFKKINPVSIVVMETELWPNLFATAKKKNIPIMLANARLSEKSADGYAYIKSLTSEMLTSLTSLASQGHADAKRFIELGMPKEKVTITGNLKFDLELPAELLPAATKLKQALGETRPIWVAASTHPTEEEIILAAHKKIGETQPNALLILVPRHPDRFSSVAQLVEASGFKMVRRSEKQACTEATSVYLCDTMGELLLMYAVSDVAFIAGSFAKIGGHNMLEAAALGKPVLTGPHLFNFAEISQMLIEAKGMIKVNDYQELASSVLHLLANNAEKNTVGQNALSVVEANRGALNKQLEMIKAMM